MFNLAFSHVDCGTPSRIDTLHAHTASQPLLRLLSSMQDCPPAIQAYVDNASHLPLLVDLTTGRVGGSDALVSGDSFGSSAIAMS